MEGRNGLRARETVLVSLVCRQGCDGLPDPETLLWPRRGSSQLGHQRTTLQIPVLSLLLRFFPSPCLTHLLGTQSDALSYRKPASACLPLRASAPGPPLSTEHTPVSLGQSCGWWSAPISWLPLSESPTRSVPESGRRSVEMGGIRSHQAQAPPYLVLSRESGAPGPTG